MKRLLLLTFLIPLSLSSVKSASCNLQNYNNDVISCLTYEGSYSQIEENIFFRRAVKMFHEFLGFLGNETARSVINHSVEKILDKFLYPRIKTHIKKIWNDKNIHTQHHTDHHDSCEVCQNLESIIFKLETVDIDVLEALSVLEEADADISEALVANQELTFINQIAIDDIQRIIYEINAISDARISKLENDFFEWKKDYLRTKKQVGINTGQVEINTGMIISDRGRIDDIENYMYNNKGFSELRLYDKHKNLIELQEGQVSWSVTRDKKIKIEFDVANCRPKDYFTFDFYFFESYSSSSIYPIDGYVMGNTGCFTCVENREITWDVIGQRKDMLGGGNLYLNVYKKSKSECKPSNQMEKLDGQIARLKKKGEYKKSIGKSMGWLHKFRIWNKKRRRKNNKQKWEESQQP